MNRAGFLIAGVFVVAAVGTSHAVSTRTCLIGTDPSVVNDSAQIRAVRSLIDAACVCADFDGTAGKTHGDYVRCAVGIINAEAAVVPGNLRSQCKGTVKRMVALSSCGRDPALHVVPCLRTVTVPDKLRCSIRPTTKRDGTPKNSCVDGAASTAVECPAITHCIDAADTNGDLVIGKPGDTGECAVNECIPDPCLNGGTCVDGIDQYTCECAPGYTGTTCEIDINECASDPCMNGGLCIDQINGFVCMCPAGYIGTICETDLNECASGPCQNGGLCYDQVNGFVCMCPAGYIGTICQTELNECVSDPCQNGGTCIDQVNGYVCDCQAGFTGTICQTDINECASDPCQNGGLCIDQVNGYVCECQAGFIGTICQTNVDECASDPCQNGGTCIDQVNGYTCECLPGCSGIICQTCQ